MQNETIHKLVTMLGEAIAGEKSQRLSGIALESANVRLEHEHAKMRNRITELEKQIAEYETILKPIRPEDEERMRQWLPLEDGPVDRTQNVGDLVNIDGECVRVIDDSEFRHFLLGDLRICYQERGRTS